MKLFQRLYAVRLHRREAAAEDNSGSIKVMATDQFMTINGLRLHYLDFGNSGKPPLICIHGLSGNAHNFDGLAEHFDPAGIKRTTDYISTAPAEFASLAEVGAYYRENYPAMRQMPEQELLEFVKWAVKPATNGGFRWKMDPAIRNAPRTGSAARPLDMWVPYARITAPILVVRGADSDILARATAQRMCVVLPQQTTIVEVPGVGHAPSLLEPEALSAITQFLSAQQSAVSNQPQSAALSKAER